MPLCNMEEKMPLVSVAVITYNSSKYVLDTLESIKAQTYKNIELIISDDCSKDNTMQLCEKWCEQNKERFARIQYVEGEQNTGVSANCNRAEDACEGEWVKIIAGDDMLLPNCIETYIDFVKNNNDAICIFSKVEVFGENKIKVDNFKDSIFDYSFFDLSYDKQYEWLIDGRPQPIPAATCFYSKKRFNDIGVCGFDKRIPLLEDWPRWITLMEKKVKFYFIDKLLVRYRVSDDSICSGNKYKPAFRKSLALLYVYYQHKSYSNLKGKKNAYSRYITNMITITDNSFRWRLVRKVYGLFLKFFNL